MLNIFEKSPKISPRFDGYYKSGEGFERYDQSWYCYLIQFFPDGTVKKGIPDKEEKFKEIGNGKYKVKKSFVECFIRSLADNFESKWIGEISDESIQFSIENPDFEDIDGKYTFVQYEQNT